MNVKIDNSLGRGSVYKPENRPSVVRRALAFIIDLVAVFLIVIVLFVFFSLAMGMPVEMMPFLMWPTFLIYFVVMKPSFLRTIGYRIMKLKVVTLRGNKPSSPRMLFRYLLWLFVSPIPDILWASADRDGRTLRDCFSGTQVLRAYAVSDHDGPIHLSRTFGFCWCMFYPQVSFPRVKTASESSVTT